MRKSGDSSHQLGCIQQCILACQVSAKVEDRSVASYSSLLFIALLNIKWARTGAPQTAEEIAIVWLQLIGGAVSGWSYFSAEMYAGLPMLWGANAMTAVATLLM